jgi:hypothetical protein
VARHVDQDVAALVRHQALGARHVLGHPVRHEPDEVLDGDVVSAVVDLDVVAVQVERAVGVVVDGAGEGVAGVAGHVVGQHEDDLRVGDPEALDGAIQREHVGEVPVVEPEARGADEDGPVGRVFSGREGRQQQQGREGSRELHACGRARRSRNACAESPACRGRPRRLGVPSACLRRPPAMDAGLPLTKAHAHRAFPDKTIAPSSAKR